MRHLILSALILCCFGSCASYQYVTLNSGQMPKNERKELTWETDTLRISYVFNGSNGTLTMRVFNKTNQSLYIDWNRSALVRDGHATGLASPRIDFSGSPTGYSQSFGRDRRSGLTQSAGYASFAGSFELPEGMNLVPPGSDITKSVPQQVDSFPISAEFLPDSARTETGYYRDGSSYKYKRYIFDAGASPLQFRAYLTFALGNDDKAMFTINHSFYAGEVITTKEEPVYYFAYGQGGDKITIRRPAQ